MTALCRFAALLCGMALTWTCAAFGLMVTRPTCRLPGVGRTEQRVLRIVGAINMYQIDHNSCPATRTDLIAGGYITAAFLVDPWGRSIAYWCTDEDNGATSAGPDGVFGTSDDIKSPGPE